MKWLLALVAICSWQAEKEELRRGLAEANSSEIEVLRFIGDHLENVPQTPFRAELERRAAQAAIAVRDNRLAVFYGEKTLVRTPDDTQLLPAVTRSLLATGSPEGAGRALLYARRTEELVRKMQQDGNPGNVNPVEWRRQTDFLLNRALIDQARASGILGHPEDALAIAGRAFDTCPDAASAHEISYWAERLGKTAEAMRALADAFTIADAHATDTDRARDRGHLGELYRQAKGSEDGLGAFCLEAYDRNTALLKAHDLRLRGNEPNAGRTDAFEFTLSALDGQPLAMNTLRGKVVVLDLWATWCVPCREQHPLYEQVKARFRDNPSVVFLSVNADADRTPVKSFLSQQKWQGPVYFEDGLAQLFAVEGLPATILLDRSGRLYTHLNGFADKTRLVDLLTRRIRDALNVPAN